MSFIFLTILLTSSAALSGLPGLETALAILILTPVWGFLVGQLVPLTPLTYWLILAASIGLLTIRRSALSKEDRMKLLKDSLLNCLLFCLVFLINHYLSLSWPDFFPMGERLRDYALIASAMHDPLSSAEPWLYGHQTSYYLFWYRFADSIAAMLHLQPWDTYHFLNAWALSLLWGASFLLSRSVLSLGRFWSSLVGTFVSYGSNFDGLSEWWFNRFASEGWWGPSRVIKGAITEFPAWSFVLGDNHPHFLSYGVVTLSIALLSRIAYSSQSSSERAISLLSLMTIVSLVLLNANAWEVPMWVGFLSVLFCGSAPAMLDLKPLSSISVWMKSRKTVETAIIFFTVSLITSLFWSAQTISSGSAVLRLVSGRSAFSTTLEIGRHWGIPLSLLLTTQLLNNQLSLLPRLLVLFGVITSLLSNNSFPLLTSLLAFEIGILWEDARLRRPFNTLLISSLTISSLGAILLCELIFLDDPYGGENERMNTIFKWYAFAWPLIHCGACGRLSQIARLHEAFLRKKNVSGILHALSFLLVSISSAFFITVARDYRPREGRKPREAEGLSRVEQELPGSRETIRQLRGLSYGAVLEAQGKPYWWTSHIATLSGMPSYLGWANHVNLLVKQPAIIAQREQNTRRWYTSSDCTTTRAELEREKVSYVVSGPLEQKEYGNALLAKFECLKLIGEHGEYRLYRVIEPETGE